MAGENAPPAVEPAIGRALNLAIGHHKVGHIDEAKKIYMDVLRAEPNQPDALHLLGVIALQRKKFEASRQLLSKAIAINPLLVEALNNLGIVHGKLGEKSEAVHVFNRALKIKSDYAEAHNNLGLLLDDDARIDNPQEHFEAAISINPSYAEAHSNLGFCLLKKGQFIDAIESFRKAIAIRSSYGSALVGLGTALLEAGRASESVHALMEAVSVEPDDGNAQYILGNAFVSEGRLHDAEKAYIRAIELDPENAMYHNNLGIARKDLGKNSEAMDNFGAAVRIDPDWAAAHNNLGSAFDQLGKDDDAVASMERSIELDPGFTEAYFNLGGVFDKNNQTEDLKRIVSEALKYCPSDPRIVFRQAQVHYRDKDNLAALSILDCTDFSGNRIELQEMAAGLKGKLHDRLGHFDTAFDQFRTCNNLSKTRLEQTGLVREKYLERIVVLSERFSKHWVDGWAPVPDIDDRPDPVFLVGFPRSGTTLLGAILGSHPQICAIDEPPTIENVRSELVSLPGGEPDGIANLSSADAISLRDKYYDTVDSLIGPRCGYTILDKNPLNLVELGIIHKIFPSSRIIFINRHPLDVILSCFSQNFKLNSATSNFLTLKDSVELYDCAMSLWCIYQELLPLKVYTIKYESIVENFDKEISNILSFLSIDWSDSVYDHTSSVKKRRDIRSASYNQVSEPIFSDSIDRWMRYSQYLNSVLPKLRPWVDRYGYSI